MKIENIKFKAKRLDGKGWAIGDLLHSYENGATKKIAKHLVIRFARNMNFKL